MAGSRWSSRYATSGWDWRADGDEVEERFGGLNSAARCHAETFRMFKGHDGPVDCHRGEHSKDDYYEDEESVISR